MYSFNICISDIIINIQTEFENMHKAYKDYITQESQADFSVTITSDDLKNIKERLLNLGTSWVHDDTPLHNFKQIAIYEKIAPLLLDHNSLLFHGSAIVFQENVYIFTGKSGTGKTTHCRWFTKNIKGSYYLNGDKPLLRFKENEVLACGTPWRGKENFGCNKTLPLKAICLIRRSKQNAMRRATSSEAVTFLLEQCLIPGELPSIRKTLTFVQRLIKKIDIYILECNISDEASALSFETLTGLHFNSYSRPPVQLN